MADTTTQTAPVNPPKPATGIAMDRIHVTIRDRSKILVDTDVKAVTSFNDTGRFDVLPAHANFICIIKQSLILHLLDGQKQTIPVENGVFKVKNGRVNCYIDLIAAMPASQTKKED